MQYKKINVNSALKKITKKDNLFCGDYTVDPYQNCEFGCIYCDSSYNKKIFIKNNIEVVLEKELKKIRSGNIIVGSVNDPYQKIEEKENKTLKILKQIKKHNFSCHILTKSNLILRDIVLLKKIKNCRVTISITTINDQKRRIIEKKLPSVKSRLETIKKLDENNIPTGLALIPLIPYFVEGELEEIISRVKKDKIKYFLYKYLELKGFQKDIFINKIKNRYPKLVDKYQNLYLESYLPNKEYTLKIDKKINKLVDFYDIKMGLC